MKVIGIVENNRVTGVVYGEVEIPDKEIKIKDTYNKMQQKRAQIQANAYKRTQHK